MPEKKPEKKREKIAVLGCGHMASALIEGIVRGLAAHAQREDDPEKKEQRGQQRGQGKEPQFKTYTPSLTRAFELAQKVGGQAVKSLKEVGDCSYLFIGCKPQQFDDLALNLKRECQELEKKHIISMMASVPVEVLKRKLGVVSVTRVMPNTPIERGEGITLLFHESENLEFKTYSTFLFKACSDVYEMESEDQLDRVTTISGCGPAYLFYFAELLVQNLREMGMNELEGNALVAKLFKGSTSLMRGAGREKDQEKNFSQLRKEVTSPKGVTMEAIKTLQREGGFSSLLKEALQEAYGRGQEIREELSL